MFIPSPLQLKALVIGAAVMAIACLSLLVWGLYWRGEYREVKAVNVALEAQGAVLADKIETCSAGVDEAKRVGDAAIASMGSLVDQARKANRDRTSTAKSIEELAARQRAKGEGCDWAWEQIEQLKRKAGAVPR